jgi:hypothetical protein
MDNDVTVCNEGKQDGDSCAKPGAFTCYNLNQCCITVRILFLWQLNGRNIRHLKRILKLIYRPYHFYHVHIDNRMNYLYSGMISNMVMHKYMFRDAQTGEDS